MFSPLNPVNSSFNALNNFDFTAHHQKPHRQAEIIGRLSSGLNRQKSDSFAIFEAVLQRSYQRIAFNSGAFRPSPGEFSKSQATQASTPYESVALPSGYVQTDKISSDQAARTILHFISGRIRSDAASGASQEELLNRLDQGLEGFVRGFNEAKGIIEDLGLLTSALSAEIEQTFTRVTEGIEKLRDRITGHTNEDQPVTNVEQLALVSQISENANFSLSLTTQDGDKVDIEVSRSFEANFSANFSNSSSGSQLALSQQTNLASTFELSVIGELDADELAAINQLLEEVDLIASDFYAGRLEQAFELAVDLEINRDELSNLNLQLKQTTRTAAIASYQSTVQSSISDPNSAIETPVSPFVKLDNLLNNLTALIQKAGRFPEPLNLIEKLSDGVSNGHVKAESNQTESSASKSSNLSEQLTTLISLFDL